MRKIKKQRDLARACNTAYCNCEKIFIQNLRATISDIYDVSSSKIMDKSPVISDTYIPPAQGEMTELIMVRVTPFEKEFYEMLSSILSELDVDGKGTKVIKNNSLSDFVRMSLSVASNSFMFNIFSDSRVKNRLMSTKAKEEFIAFRTKYMNIPNEF